MSQQKNNLSQSSSPSPPGEGLKIQTEASGRSPKSPSFNIWGEVSEAVVIKIGGNIIDDPAALQALLQSLATISGPKVLIHGGGKLATRLAQQLNIPQQMVNGRRITDAATLQIVTMVYAGDINKRIVAGLQANGVNAIGLTGADGNFITAIKRTGTDTDYGFVGDVAENGVNGGLLMQLLQAGLTPVIAPITHDGSGQLLNTNADTVANETAVALAAHTAVNLVFCFEKNGVLQNPEDDNSVIALINAGNFVQLREAGIITAGMIPKIENALAAVQRGVKKVIIGNGAVLPHLLAGTAGTVIKQ